MNGMITNIFNNNCVATSFGCLNDPLTTTELSATQWATLNWSSTENWKSKERIEKAESLQLWWYWAYADVWECLHEPQITNPLQKKLVVFVQCQRRKFRSPSFEGWKTSVLMTEYMCEHYWVGCTLKWMTFLTSCWFRDRSTNICDNILFCSGR